MQYPINSIFQTLQGEGVYTGVPAIFIRLQGCTIGCNWCDTKYTWNKRTTREIPWQEVLLKTEESDHWGTSDETTVLRTITRCGWTAKHIVITGGEPCLHDLRPLTIALQSAGFTCQIETSGTSIVLCTAETWVTVSPKINMRSKYSVLPQALTRADEIKHPVSCQRDIDMLISCLNTLDDPKKRVIALQPINHISHAIQLCIKNCIARNWRLSLQTHKYLNTK
ncbi:7-carboxy-7-deazaguanine synthase QueE [Candidatus Erwinia haradaeae]|uniref:7-carboxy-7-deazaguanine synthase n=1 Tax=Candidatus Erwinia haradaeae TaxID=1922217 RepID=A0A451DAN3_9GAMM|nr:7-carboxy-7-deazaguanine synthase QueE [Candidatus Erwinia haradaeae]VFP83354.1 7-carboxy-7-deazaguanine synthase [Candidatus Erwinia haradaeae]